MVEGGGKHRCLHGAGHYCGGKEYPLIHPPQGLQGAAHLPAHARTGEAVGAPLHQLLPSGDIPPCGSNAAARVLDEGTSHQVGPHLGGFPLFHQLPVAVVHHNDNIWVFRLGCLGNLADDLNCKAGAQAVAPAPLDVDNPGLLGSLCNGRKIGGAVRQQLHLPVFHPPVHQGAITIPPDTDGLLQGVVGGPCHRYQQLSRAQHPKEGGSQGVGAGDKGVAHQGVLRSKDGGKNGVQAFPPPVVVAVAGGAL